MKPRLALFVLAAFALLVSTGADCRGLPGMPRDPMPPVGPDSTWTYAPTVYQVVTTISKDAIRYVMDWGDTIDTTTAEYASGETAFVSHAWTASGDYPIRVMAFNAARPERASGWSPYKFKSVRVIPDNAPVIDSAFCPPVAVRGETTSFTVYAHDPDGGSTRAVVAWNDSTDTTTSFFPSPSVIFVSHVFTQVETAVVVMSAQDLHGAVSLPDTVLVPVGARGFVYHAHNVGCIGGRK